MERGEQTALISLLMLLALALQSCAASSVAPAAATPTVSQFSLPSAGESSGELPNLPPDPAGQGRTLTDYFKTHELPLVGANVVDDKDGRQVILYGFVATPLGKADAEAQARRIFRDPKVVVVNRIAVRPELLTMDKSAPSVEDSSAMGSAAGGSVLTQLTSQKNYLAPDQSQASAYQQQGSQSNWVTILTVVLMIAPMFIP